MASYETTQANCRPSKRSCLDSGSSDEESTTEYFPRWFVIEGTDKTDNGKTLMQLSPFITGKSLKCRVGTLKIVKRLQRGDILVETDKPDYVKLLLKMNTLADVPVKVSNHRTLNICNGVIRCRDVASCEQKEILQNLQSQGVVDAVVVTLKSDTPQSERMRTNTVILSFNRPQPPQYASCTYVFQLPHLSRTRSAVSSVKSSGMVGNTAKPKRKSVHAVARLATTTPFVKTKNIALTARKIMLHLLSHVRNGRTEGAADSK